MKIYALSSLLNRRKDECKQVISVEAAGFFYEHLCTKFTRFKSALNQTILKKLRAKKSHPQLQFNFAYRKYFAAVDTMHVFIYTKLAAIIINHDHLLENTKKHLALCQKLTIVAVYLR